jgi:hypothetical protein
VVWFGWFTGASITGYANGRKPGDRIHRVSLRVRKVQDRLLDCGHNYDPILSSLIQGASFDIRYMYSIDSRILCLLLSFSVFFYVFLDSPCIEDTSSKARSFTDPIIFLTNQQRPEEMRLAVLQHSVHPVNLPRWHLAVPRSVCARVPRSDFHTTLSRKQIKPYLLADIGEGQLRKWPNIEDNF